MADMNHQEPDEKEPNASFDVEVDGSVAVLALRGELDLATAPELEQVVRSLLADRSVERFVVDMTGLTFMDSSGLAVLLQAAAGGQVLLRSPSVVIRQVIESTGLTGVLVIEP